MDNQVNFDLEKFDDLAKQNGISVRYWDKDRSLDVVYKLPAGHMTRLYELQVVVPYFDHEDFLRKSDCSLFLRYRWPNQKRKESEVRLNCKTQKEAFGFLYLLLFMPEKIGYVLNKGGVLTDVTSDELFMTGKISKNRIPISYIIFFALVLALIVVGIKFSVALIIIGSIMGVIALLSLPIYWLFVAPEKESKNHEWKYTLMEDPNVDGYLITGIFRDKAIRKEEKKDSDQCFERRIHRRMFRDMFRK